MTARLISAAFFLVTVGACSEAPSSPLSTDSRPRSQGFGKQRPPCDPVADEGCPPRRSCRLFRGVPRCLPEEAGQLPLKSPCTPGTCASGLACLRSVSSSTASKCLRLCHPETGEGCEQAEGEHACLSRIRGSSLGTCEPLTPRCDPYKPTACRPTEACQPFPAPQGTYFRCQNPGPAGPGERCGTKTHRCQRDLICVQELRGPTCRRYCTRNVECTAPEQCTGRVRVPQFTYCQP